MDGPGDTMSDWPMNRYVIGYSAPTGEGYSFAPTKRGAVKLAKRLAKVGATSVVLRRRDDRVIETFDARR